MWLSGIHLLPGELTLGELNCTSNGAPMKPSISIDTEYLTGEFL